MSRIVSALSRPASLQLGCFTRAQARTDLISDHQLRGLVRSGVLEAHGPRVFRFTGSTRSWLQDVMIACLDGGPQCVASHRTAAALYRFDGFARGGVIEVLVPMEVRHRRPDVIVHHTRELPDQDRARVGCIPVTSVARTLIDLGAVLPATTVEEALDAAERDSVVGRNELLGRYDALRAPGRNGIGAMTQILAGRDQLKRVPRSVLERRMERALRLVRLPRPTARYLLRLPDRLVELDLAFPAVKVGIELDAHGAHATRRQRAADHERQNAIEDAHWTLRRFTFEQVMYDLDGVVAAIRSALASASNRV